MRDILLVLLLSFALLGQKRLPYQPGATGGGGGGGGLTACAGGEIPTIEAPGNPASAQATWTRPSTGATWCDPLSNSLVTLVSSTYSTDPNSSRVGWSPGGTGFWAANSGGGYTLIRVNPSTLATSIVNSEAYPATNITYSEDGLSEGALFSRPGFWINESEVLMVGFRSIYKVNVSGPSPWTAHLVADLSPHLAGYKALFPSIPTGINLGDCWFSSNATKGMCRLGLTGPAMATICPSSCPNNIGYITFSLTNFNTTTSQSTAQANVTLRRKFINAIDSATYDTFQTAGALGTLYSGFAGGYKNRMDLSGDYVFFEILAGISMKISDGSFQEIPFGNHGVLGVGEFTGQEDGGGLNLEKWTLGGSSTGTVVGRKIGGQWTVSMYMTADTNGNFYIYEGPDTYDYMTPAVGYPHSAPDGTGTGGALGNRYARPNRISKIGASTMTNVVFTYVGIQSGYVPGTVDIRNPTVSPDGALIAFFTNMGLTNDTKYLLIAKVQ